MGSKSRATDGLRITAIEKKHLILENRKMRYTYEEIARRVPGCSKGYAHQVVVEYMESFRIANQGVMTEIVTLELQTLDRLQQAIYTKAMKGEAAAIKNMLKIMERRARLLGLDAPKKMDVTNHPPVLYDAEDANA